MNRATFGRSTPFFPQQRASGPAGVAGPRSGAGRPILDQVSQIFERLLQEAGVKLDNVSDPAQRLMDRVSKLADALARDPGLLQRLQQKYPELFRVLQQFRSALEAMLPSLSGAERQAAEMAIRQIDSMTTATTQKPIVPPRSEM